MVMVTLTSLCGYTESGLIKAVSARGKGKRGVESQQFIRGELHLGLYHLTPGGRIIKLAAH